MILPALHYEAKLDLGLRDAKEPLSFPLESVAGASLFGKPDESLTVAAGFARLARAYVEMGRSAEALPLMEQWVRTNRNVSGALSPSTTEAEAALANIQLNLGRADNASTTAREAYSSARAFVATRANFPGSAWLVANIMRAPSQAMLDVLAAAQKRDGDLARNALAEAFEVGQQLQRSAAALAMEGLGARLAQSDAQTRERERHRQDLLDELDKTRQFFVRTATGRVTDGDRSAEERAQARIAEIAAELASSSAEGDVARFGSSDAIPLRELQEGGLIGDDEALLSFVVGDGSTFVWLVTKTQASWRVVPLGAQAIKERVTRLRCGLDAGEWETLHVTPESSAQAQFLAATQERRRNRCVELTGVRYDPASSQLLPFDLDAAHGLYSELLGELAPSLRGKQLLVVLSGALSSLPIGVLVTSPPPAGLAFEEALGKTSWLGAESPIVVLPAVSSLRSLRQKASAPSTGRGYAAFANPLVNGLPRERYEQKAEDARERRRCDEELARACNAPTTDVAQTRSGAMGVAAHIREFTPLPQTACEVCAIAEGYAASGESLDDRVRLGARATRAEVRRLGQSELQRYRYLHFATHGVPAGGVIRDGVAEPGLILTPGAVESDPDDDGFLSATDIAQMKLDADWVILSACNSAAGESAEGESLSGLARAFIHAGARGLLVTHWDINTDAAVAYTTGALSYLEQNKKTGMKRADAAKLVIQDFLASDRASARHPSAWGAFSIVGGGRD